MIYSDLWSCSLRQPNSLNSLKDFPGHGPISSCGLSAALWPTSSHRPIIDRPSGDSQGIIWCSSIFLNHKVRVDSPFTIFTHSKILPWLYIHFLIIKNHTSSCGPISYPCASPYQKFLCLSPNFLCICEATTPGADYGPARNPWTPSPSFPRQPRHTLW